ncbi:MAG: hypothetical protein FWH47_04500 [Methanomassiliicoccaceae archaeon]|nr:hypothetical protein [Methanomassiliicoccaceae archaeon]
MRDDALLGFIIGYCAEIECDRARFGDNLDDFLEDTSYPRSCCMNPFCESVKGKREI